jgi:hypothetical protein
MTYILIRRPTEPTAAEMISGHAVSEWPAVYRCATKAQEVADRLNARGEEGGGWVVETEQ